MSQDYRQLIRLARWTLDEKRREQAQAYAQLDAVDRALADLDHQVVAEQGAAAADAVGAMAYGPFVTASLERRKALMADRAAALREVDAHTEALRAAFEEVKRYEMMQEQKDRRARLARDRAEQADLDEIAQRRTGER